MPKKFKSSQPQLKVYWFLQRKYTFVVLNLLNFRTKKSRSMLRLDRKKNGNRFNEFSRPFTHLGPAFLQPEKFLPKKRLLPYRNL